ncbi:universal stress protein [Methyloceanibacter sp.]|uniref:universal stress protein n=1 Tax=Methyloceanibacter sp. TaxID=1965321 RepID=UPI002088CBB8|nr:universal stress protein [Methyloceanibacter sp.]GFO81917.1 MAG: hypothetical protein A49_15440 [Methyloceanibacter sp.]HML92272.1 universal stress protein [Methyloceanibacter sp.]
MSKRILCAVDGSEPSSRAVAEAAEMAGAEGAELILLVVDQVRFEPRLAPVHAFGEKRINEILSESEAAAKKAGAKNIVKASVTSRDVGRAVLNYAEEHGVDHLVVGTGEKSAGARLIVGSVSHDLVVRAHCSVTVAR